MLAGGQQHKRKVGAEGDVARFGKGKERRQCPGAEMAEKKQVQDAGGDAVNLLELFELHGRATYETARRMVAESGT